MLSLTGGLIEMDLTLIISLMYKHLNCVGDFNLIPNQAFLFKPQRSNRPEIADDYRRYEGDKYRRLLFQGWAQETYTVQEKQKLKEFQLYVDKKGITLDKRWDNPWKLRWLISTGYDFEKSVEEMGVFQEYMGGVRELSFTHKVAQNLKAGLFYMVGRDSHYRPIIVFDVEKIINADLSDQECLQTQTYFFQYIMRHFFIPGQVESWVSLIDSNYQSLFSIMGAMQNAFVFLSNTYRMRLYSCYNCRINLPLRMIWKVVQKFLDPETVNKIMLFDDLKPFPLYEIANLSQFQQRFGGTLPNVKEGEFWPPRQYVSPDYHTKSQKTVLMTQQQYTQNYQKGVLFDTKICEQLLISRGPAQLRENHQKKVLKQMQKKFEREFELLQKEDRDLSRVFKMLEKVGPQISFKELVNFDTLENSKMD